MVVLKRAGILSASFRLSKRTQPNDSKVTGLRMFGTSPKVWSVRLGGSFSFLFGLCRHRFGWGRGV